MLTAGAFDPRLCSRNAWCRKELALPLNRVVLYVRNIEVAVAFYERHFSFKTYREQDDRIVELINPAGGASLMLHLAAKGQKTGQSTVKLVFDVEDVEAFAAGSAKKRTGIRRTAQGGRLCLCQRPRSQ